MKNTTFWDLLRKKPMEISKKCFWFAAYMLDVWDSCPRLQQLPILTNIATVPFCKVHRKRNNLYFVWNGHELKYIIFVWLADSWSLQDGLRLSTPLIPGVCFWNISCLIFVVSYGFVILSEAEGDVPIGFLCVGDFSIRLAKKRKRDYKLASYMIHTTFEA